MGRMGAGALCLLLLGNLAGVNAHPHGAQVFAGNVARLLDREDSVGSDGDAGFLAGTRHHALHDETGCTGVSDPEAKPLRLRVKVQNGAATGLGNLVDAGLGELELWHGEASCKVSVSFWGKLTLTYAKGPCDKNSCFAWT